MSDRAAGEGEQAVSWGTMTTEGCRTAAMHPRRRDSHRLCGRAGAVNTDEALLSLRHSLIIQHVNGFIAFRPIPGMPRGGFLPPAPVLAPESALGSRPRVALPSAQVTSV
jgi:hypothetical protein